MAHARNTLDPAVLPFNSLFEMQWRIGGTVAYSVSVHAFNSLFEMPCSARPRLCAERAETFNSLFEMLRADVYLAVKWERFVFQFSI